MDKKNKYPFKEYLDRDEESRLILKAQSKDKNAMLRLIEANLGFIRKEMRCRWVPESLLLDRENAAIIGFINAVKKFKVGHKSGSNIRTFSKWWIIVEVWEMAESSIPIRLPGHQITKYPKIIEASKKFFGKHGRYPTDYELGKITDTSEKNIEYLRFARQEMLSLDTNPQNDDSSILHDLCPDTEGFSPDSSIILQQEIINPLNESILLLNKILEEMEKQEPLTRLILSLYHGIGCDIVKSHEEIENITGMPAKKSGKIITDFWRSASKKLNTDKMKKSSWKNWFKKNYDDLQVFIDIPCLL